MANIIIVGCGRVGSRLATLLSQNDGNVCVIDKDAEAFSNLSRNFNGNTLQGMGFDEDVLIQAGVKEADVVAAVTQSDNSNLMVVEVAKRIFGVPRCFARLYNPARERAYNQLGLDYVCGTSLVAEGMFSKIVSDHGNHLDTFGDFEVLRFSLDTSHLGKDSVKVSAIEKNHGIRIIAFERRDGSVSSIPTGSSILYHGDSVLAAVRHDLLRKFSKYMQN